MTTDPDTTGWAHGPRLALDQLRALERPDGLRIVAVTYVDSIRWLEVTVSIPTDGIARGPGIGLRAREQFVFTIKPRHPMSIPVVQVSHTRWAGTPHVQWGRQLCLYAAPSIEWHPGDGMRGLVERLLWWLDRAAQGTLDGDDLPVHPPVAYALGNAGTVVVREDLAGHAPGTEPVLLVGLCLARGERLDVVAWTTPQDFTAHVAQGRHYAYEGTVLGAVTIVLLPGPIGFEFPEHGTGLLDGLAAQGVSSNDLIALMAVTSHGNVTTAPLRGVPSPAEGHEWQHGPGGVPPMVLVGTPSRVTSDGEVRIHLVAWRTDTFTGSLAGLMGRCLQYDTADFAAIAADVADLGRRHISSSPIRWARVLEDRSEVTVPRDTGSSARLLTDRSVLVLGAGALGAPVVEMLVRAGAQVAVVDNGIVTPGILRRQPYTDDDIGANKAQALAERLRRSRHEASVHDINDDAVGVIETLQPATYDLIVDATADRACRAALELRRVHTRDGLPDLVTMVVGHDARRGLVTISRAGATGTGHDILRRVGIAAHGGQAGSLGDIAADLYPLTPRTDLFSPEPGCSAPTFRGSHVEATALAAALLNAGLDVLADRVPAARGSSMSAAAIRLDHDPAPAATTWLAWADDHVHQVQGSSWQVRLSPQALTTIRAEARDAARRFGPGIETGGMLLGHVDEATGVVHVDIATPPTPDSRCSAVHFEHGTEGSQALVDHYIEHSGRHTSFVGMWHTHPHHDATPSPTDAAGMANLVTPVLGGPPRALMLIVGGHTNWTAWVAGEPDAQPDVHVDVVRRHAPGEPVPPQPPAPPGTYYVAGDRADTPSHNADDVPWWRRWLRTAR